LKCTCEIDENGKVIMACDIHKKWFREEIKKKQREQKLMAKGY
jgi:hypothetical protein